MRKGFHFFGIILLLITFYSCALKEKETNSWPVSSYLFETQYVAHARYFNDSLAENSLPLYKYLIEDLKYRIVECDVLFTSDNVPVLMHSPVVSELGTCDDAQDINDNTLTVSQMPFEKLKKYNFSKTGGGVKLRITTFEELLVYAKIQNRCIQIDLQKHVFGETKMKQLYDIVAKHGMTNKVIWEINDADFDILTKIDKHLIIQLDQKWDKVCIDNINNIKHKASLIILSNWFPDFDNIDYKDVIDYGHVNGFLMKCSIVNDSCIANQLFTMGVDLIVTDCLSFPVN